jgi:hypothetical protein
MAQSVTSESSSIPKRELVITAMRELRKLDHVQNEWVSPATVETFIVENLGEAIGACGTTMADMTKPEFSPRNSSSKVPEGWRILERKGRGLYRVTEQFDPPVNSKRRRENLLDAIQREHILQAIKLFDDGHTHTFADSTKFDLAYNGRSYPPKAIIGLAGVPLYGEPLKPDDFTGGAGSKCFRVLSREGFEVVPKVSEFRPTADQDELKRRTREAISAPILPKPAAQVAPRQVSRETQTYERDPLVRAFVLRRAKGKCECCGEDAPFVDRDGEPFLEVHHIQPLAEGGDDVVENAAAICPNCHRECHHGRNLLKLRQHLLDRAGSFANAESSAADG